MEELQILQKTYDMILYAYIALHQFPKHEKHVLSAEIRHCMFKLSELIIVTNKKYYKKTTLQEIDVELEKLRIFIRLSNRKNRAQIITWRQLEQWFSVWGICFELE